MRFLCFALISCLLFTFRGIEAKTVGDLNQSVISTKVSDNKKDLEYQLGDTVVDPAIKKTGRLDKSDPLYGAIIKALGVTIVPAKDLGAATAEDFDDAASACLVELPYEKGHFVGWVERDTVFFGKTGVHPNAQLTVGLFNKDLADPNPKSISLISNLIATIPIKYNERIWSFDFASYNLGSLGRAFGIRTMLEGCGAGGSLCSNT